MGSSSLLESSGSVWCVELTFHTSTTRFQFFRYIDALLVSNTTRTDTWESYLVFIITAPYIACRPALWAEIEFSCCYSSCCFPLFTLRKPRSCCCWCVIVSLPCQSSAKRRKHKAHKEGLRTARDRCSVRRWAYTRAVVIVSLVCQIDFHC